MVEPRRRTLTAEEIHYISRAANVDSHSILISTEGVSQQEKDRLAAFTLLASERIVNAYKEGDSEAKWLLEHAKVWRDTHFRLSRKKDFNDFICNEMDLKSTFYLLAHAAIDDPDKQINGQYPYNQVTQFILFRGIISYTPKPITERQI